MEEEEQKETLKDQEENETGEEVKQSHPVKEGLQEALEWNTLLSERSCWSQKSQHTDAVC